MAPAKSRKIAVLGYRSVGKSSLAVQFVDGRFVDCYDPTIENTFTKTLNFDGQEFYLQLVDTAGQDEYSIFSFSHTVNIHGYILVYSVTSMKSFEMIKIIRSKLLDKVGKIHRPSSPHYAPPFEPPCFCQMCRIPTVLVANKKDLTKQRVVKIEEGKKLAHSWGAAFLESSAKQNDYLEFPRFLHSSTHMGIYSGQLNYQPARVWNMRGKGNQSRGESANSTLTAFALKHAYI
ncbi:GTP-binding protein Rheb-like isoform X1 [Leucoraja erinacea]|uniref:GTP-binding protein Rheb-like isoform X1 n=1 Tax=Leucoraja erinaceus TaxID=7782 RepID=UPI0024541D36|nr:GTP-binding protein Rheb-like isoform X1 [Leucoraja erinacea]